MFQSDADEGGESGRMGGDDVVACNFNGISPTPKLTFPFSSNFMYANGRRGECWDEAFFSFFFLLCNLRSFLSSNAKKKKVNMREEGESDRCANDARHQ